MSLINDALKKAQTLQARPVGTNASFPQASPATPAAASPARTPASTPALSLVPKQTATLAPIAPPVTPETTLPYRRTKSSQAGVVIAIAGIVLMIGLGAIGYVVYALFFSAAPADPVADAAPPAPAVAQPAAPAAAKPAQPVSAAPAPATAPTPAAATAPVKPAPAPVAAAVTPAPAAQVASVAAAPAHPAPPPPEPVAEEEVVPEHVNNPAPHIQAWVDKITLTGVRAAEAHSKVLMNDRVYEEGDIVDRALGLRLSKVLPRTLIFVDAEGNTYEFGY